MIQVFAGKPSTYFLLVLTRGWSSLVLWIILFKVAHFSKACNLVWSWDFTFFAIELEAESVTSSANRLVFSRGNCTGRLLINNSNKRGPSIEPCGTPDTISRASEYITLILLYTYVTFTTYITFIYLKMSLLFGYSAAHLYSEHWMLDFVLYRNYHKMLLLYSINSYYSRLYINTKELWY